MKPHLYSESNGFSLLEMVMVLVLLSILTVVVLSRHISGVELSANTQVLAAHIRYAQLHSMNTDQSWGITYDDVENAYWLFANGNTGSPIPLPGQTTAKVSLDTEGISISPPFELSFDGWGRPSSDAAGTGTLTLTLTKPGHIDEKIEIIKETGFSHITD